MKLLVGITKGHDIPEAEQAVKDVLYDVDKYVVCYYPQLVALTMIRHFFLKHDYTHLAILPDDLIVTREALLILLDDIARHNFRYLAGCCNVDNTDYNDAISVSTRPVRAAGNMGRYRFLYRDTAEYRKLLKLCVNRDYPVEFYFEGFQFPIIRRDVIEMIPFSNDTTGGAQDVAFDLDLREKGIPILVDLRAEMHHMKISDAMSLVTLKVGFKKCDNYLEKANGEIIHYDAPEIIDSGDRLLM